MERRIYLDHAAGSPLRPCAATAWAQAMAAGYGNPGSPHREGQRARAALERARTDVAQVLDVPPRSIVFTGGGTEAARIGLVGAVGVHGGPVTCSALEHPAILGPAQRLAREGHAMRLVPVDGSGAVDSAAFLRVCKASAVAALLAIHHETGVIQPVEAVGAALREQGIPLVCDAALAPGRIPLGPLLEAAPLVSMSAHKFGGPPGMGLLVVAPGTPVWSPACGGWQEEGLRAGTPNVPGALAAAAALQDACSELSERTRCHQRFTSWMTEALDASDDWSLIGSITPHAGILCLASKSTEGESLMMNLDLQGFAVATGSSCALGGTDPSPGLLAMGFDGAHAARTIRISFGWNTIDEDVKSICECIRTTSPGTSRSP